MSSIINIKDILRDVNKGTITKKTCIDFFRKHFRTSNPANLDKEIVLWDELIAQLSIAFREGLMDIKEELDVKGRDGIIENGVIKMAEDRLLTFPEAAKYLGVKSRQHIDNLTKSGALQYVIEKGKKRGKKIAYSAILHYMEQNKKSP